MCTDCVVPGCLSPFMAVLLNSPLRGIIYELYTSHSCNSIPLKQWWYQIGYHPLNWGIFFYTTKKVMY